MVVVVVVVMVVVMVVVVCHKGQGKEISIYFLARDQEGGGHC